MQIIWHLFNSWVIKRGAEIEIFEYGQTSLLINKAFDEV
jgi:hypothetical protein